MSQVKPTTLLFDLCLLLMPPFKEREGLLVLCELDGTTLVCSSGLQRNLTLAALRELRLLNHLDRVIFPSESASQFAHYVALVADPSVLLIDTPKEATYFSVQHRLHKSRRQSIHRFHA
jgi:hypothetical protein